MTKNQPTVVIVEDDRDMRRSMERMILDIALKVEVYASPEDFLAAFDPTKFGCFIFDLRMPVMSGMQLFENLQSAHKYVSPVIFVSGEADIKVSVEAMRWGAWDFLEKPFSRSQLLDNVNAAIAFDVNTRAALAEKKLIEHRIDSLTQREREILNLIMEGKATKEIAKQLGVTTKTVEGHRAHLYTKMDVLAFPQLALLIARFREIEAFLGLHRNKVSAPLTPQMERISRFETPVFRD